MSKNKNGRAPTTNGTVRCAVYTRKSTDEGLDQEFTSLDAQREAAEAYVASQKHDGWRCLPQRYDAAPDPQLVDRAMALRLREGILTKAGMKGNNVAVAKVEVDGVIQYIEKVSDATGHSEELIANEIIQLRAAGHAVQTLELFTERVPCGGRNANCRIMMAEHMEGVRVFFYTRASNPKQTKADLWSIYSR